MCIEILATYKEMSAKTLLNSQNFASEISMPNKIGGILLILMALLNISFLVIHIACRVSKQLWTIS